MLKRLLNIRTREEKIHDVIQNIIQNIHSEEYNFTLEEQTDIIEGVQKAQFEILERKLSELKLVKDQIDRITILSVHA